MADAPAGHPLDDAGAIDTGTLPDVFVPPADTGAADAADASDAADAADASDAAEDASACAWDGSYESPACTECLRAQCCGTATTCETDPACVAVDQCVNGCATSGGASDAGDGGSIATCAQNCFDSQPPAVKTEWQAFSNCLEFQCGNSGAGPCE